MKTSVAALLFIASGCATGSPEIQPDGCWVNAYAEAGYRGAMTTYTGPSFETSFTKGASSLAIGPAARLEGYEDETPLVLGPGTRVPRFDGRLSSFKLVCVY